MRLLVALVRGLEVREEIDHAARVAAAKRAVEGRMERFRAEWSALVNHPLYRLHARIDYAMEPTSPRAIAAREVYVERRLAEIMGGAS